MGYRSQAGLTITLPAGITRKDVEEVINLEEFFTECAEWKVLDFTEDNLHTFKGISDWDKLYTNNKEYMQVKAFLNWLEEKIDEKIDENSKDCGGYHYLEIGDDWDDFEEITYGEPWEYVGYERSLH